jgi:hypothetical protein
MVALAGLKFLIKSQMILGKKIDLYGIQDPISNFLKSGQCESTTWLQYQYQTLMIRSFSFSKVALSGSASVGTPHLA